MEMDKLKSLQEEFLNKLREQVKGWVNTDISLAAKIDGLSRSLLEVIDKGYILAPIDLDSSKLMPAISGSLLKGYMGETPVKNEVEQEFLEHVKEIGNYWSELAGNYGDKYRLDGFIFSILVALDGDAVLSPLYIANKSDKKVHLAGYLHEMYHIR